MTSRARASSGGSPVSSASPRSVPSAGRNFLSFSAGQGLQGRARRKPIRRRPWPRAFTGSFDDVQQRGGSYQGLIAQGAELVWTSGDGIGNGVAAAAEQAKHSYAGRHRQRRRTGEEGQHRQRRARHVSDLQGLRGRGERRQLRQKFFVSGLANHGLILTPVNKIDKRVPADLQKQVDALVGQLASGAKTLPDFYGPAK